ncbi:MAG TPA: ribonucleoside-diphosphate reductase, adenosylcobalamin-dependent, partial [Roseovarius nubinhibens]|nr:ribonucleoside-diphosphate reductase, adenosylcobalamin-dependent [Roseovarius nubinhibens]
IANASYAASARLAGEKGAFPLYDAKAYAKAPMIKKLDAETRALIAEHGLRNALLTSVAPTGTISLYAGNVSSGIEPIFANSYTRKVLQKDGSRTEEEVVDYAVQMWRDVKGDAPLPEYFVNAQTLSPADHVRMQAAAQDWVDSSISKTINCPEDIDFEAFKDVYMQAWDTGCKGCTTYRPNDVTGSVLSVEAPA